MTICAAACHVYFFTAQTAVAVFQAEKDEIPGSYRGSIKGQHCLADMVYTPHLEQRDKRATANIKHVLAFGWCRIKEGSSG